MAKKATTATADAPVREIVVRGFLTNQLPSVIGSEYWNFRRSTGQTHADYTAMTVANRMPADATADSVRKYILSTFDTAAVASSDVNSPEHQVLQYLGQLNASGWNRLINRILGMIRAKSLTPNA